MSEMTSETRSPVDGAPDECRTAASDRGLREARVAIGSSDFDAIGIDGLVSLWSEAGLRDFEAISCHGNGAVVQVAVERPLDADRLDAFECVDRWEHVPGAEAGELYVIEFTAPEFPPSLADRTDCSAPVIPNWTSTASRRPSGGILGGPRRRTGRRRVDRRRTPPAGRA